MEENKNVVYIIRASDDSEFESAPGYGMYSTYDKALDVIRLLLIEDAACGYDGISYWVEEYELDSEYNKIFDKVNKTVNGALEELRS